MNFVAGSEIPDRYVPFLVEELALEFQESYERALRRGLNPDEAWQDVRNHERSWRELADDSNHGGERNEMKSAADELLAIKKYKLGWPSFWD